MAMPVIMLLVPLSGWRDITLALRWYGVDYHEKFEREVDEQWSDEWSVVIRVSLHNAENWVRSHDITFNFVNGAEDMAA